MALPLSLKNIQTAFSKKLNLRWPYDMSSNLLQRAGEGGLKIMLCEAVPTILYIQENYSVYKHTEQEKKKPTTAWSNDDDGESGWIILKRTKSHFQMNCH